MIGELGKGGAEYQLYELLRGLDRRRFAPEVFALAAGGYWGRPIRELGIRVHELAANRSADVDRLRRLRAVLRAFAPHVLHTVLWSGNSYGRLAAVGLGIPVVITAERNVIARPRWQRLVERALDRVTDVYLLNSAAITRQLVDRGGLPEAKMRVVPNGIDLAGLPPVALERRAARAALGFPVERRLVAQVGRLAPQKDWPTFLRAMAQVTTALPDVDVLAVGTGEQRDELERLTADLGLHDRVRFLGLRHDVPRILAASDVMALTSLYEGLPNVVIEAMATGAVAVATDVGGTGELVRHEGTGLLVQPRDADGIAAAVRRVLDDGALATRLATAARAVVERELSLETMVARTTQVYEERLAAHGVAAAA